MAEDNVYHKDNLNILILLFKSLYTVIVIGADWAALSIRPRAYKPFKACSISIEKIPK
jgi:hypothetical protein